MITCDHGKYAALKSQVSLLPIGDRMKFQNSIWNLKLSFGWVGNEDVNFILVKSIKFGFRGVMLYWVLKILTQVYFEVKKIQIYLTIKNSLSLR